VAAFEGEYTGWIELVADSLLRPPRGLAHESVGRRLGRTFGCFAGQAWVEPDGSLGLELWDAPPGWTASAHRASWRGRPATDHPVVSWFLDTGDSTATTLARANGRQRSSGGRRPARPAPAHGLEHQLWIPVRCSDEKHRSFVLARPDADFSDEELALACRLQPLIMLLDRQRDWSPDQGEEQTTLTDRELAVLRLLADGETAAGIGRRLGISPRTAQKHLEHLYRKLGVGDRLLAVRSALEAGLVESPTPATGEPDEAP